MPAQRPRASFEPIPPDLNLDELIEQTPNFQLVDRISCDMIDEQGMDAFDKLVQLHVVKGGKPLVIDGYQNRLDAWTFSPKWLQDNHGDKIENARDLRKDNLYTPLTIGHYVRNMSRLAGQFFENPENYRQLDRQRVYLKDIDCPPVWFDKIRDHLPPNLLYFNESTGDLGGPGSVDENAPTGGKRKGKGIAGAGDLMSSLPSAMRAENLMCYIGHEGTYTPAHREMCASLGQNIMVECSEGLSEDGEREQPGSSIWFMTESKDRHTVSEYWLSILGHDIEVEKHFAQLAAWKKAPFTTYIVEQKAGDLILIPPLAPHQVWNRGTRTMKVAWNRTTVETLDLAFKEALASARLVCRDEQYKNKAIVYYTMQKYSTLLAKAKDQEQTASSPQEALALQKSPKIRHLRRDFKKLFNLFKEILLSEMFAPDTTHERSVQFLPFESNVTCAYCRGNIFNRFLTCTTCEYFLGTPEAEPYDMCMDCFVMGRSCGCISKFKWVEQFKWKELSSKYEQWRRQYLEIDNSSDVPLPLAEERQRYPKKTTAQICQEQLKRRPWRDIQRPQLDDEDEESEDEEIVVNDDGTVKKPRKRRSETWLRNNRACHVCAHRHEKWKMIECPCGKWWCFGSLFRAHDLMPMQILEDPNWKCPHCRGICNAGMCRKDTRQTPYEPKGTLLGHDTKKVADIRSVESLVDFSVSNLNWIKESTEAPIHNARLTKRREEADRAKENEVIPDDVEVSDAEGDIEYQLSDQVQNELENFLIDPSLRDDDPSITTQGSARPSNGSAVPVSTLLNPDGGDNNDSAPLRGYQAATQAGFQAPFAQMHLNSLDGANDEAEDSTFIAGLGTGQMRHVNIKDTTSTKKRRQEDPPADGNRAMSGASKQYLREMERHALEVARKKGKYILTQAALRGKSRIVKLHLGQALLAEVITRQATANNSTNNDLLRSDVHTEKPKPPPTLAEEASHPMETDKPKAVRIRVEKDDDFMTSRKRGKATATTTPGILGKKRNQPAFEEVEIDSMSASGDEVPYEAEGNLESTAADRKNRLSRWQAKHHGEDDDNVPEQLPDNWKDKPPGPRRERLPKPQTANGSSFVAANGGNGAARTNLQRDTRTAASGDWSGEEDEDDIASGVKAVASISGSIFSRSASARKKIKIVSARDRH